MRSELTQGERTELGLIILVGVALWAAAPLLPEQIGIGSFLLLCSSLVLFQGLVRDLFLLRRANSSTPPGQIQKARCICLESTFGICGIILGAVLMTIDSGKPIEMTRWCWGLSAMVTLGAGFLIKDYVLGWDPCRIYKDKDHRHLIVAWKQQ